MTWSVTSFFFFIFYLNSCLSNLQKHLFDQKCLVIPLPTRFQLFEIDTRNKIRINFKFSINFENWYTVWSFDLTDYSNQVGFKHRKIKYTIENKIGKNSVRFRRIFAIYYLYQWIGWARKLKHDTGHVAY